MIKLIVFGSNRPALVDDDFAHLIAYRWRLDDKGHVYRNGSRVYKLRRVILGEPPVGFMIDFNSGDKLDCRRENLRVIPISEKHQNPTWRASNKTGHRGVYFDKSRGKYVASVRHNGHNYNFGRFATVEEAAEAVRLGRPAVLSLSVEV